MNLRANWMTVAQLTVDTFRQARASGIFWMMLIVTAVCVFVCLSVDASGDAALYSPGEVSPFLPPVNKAVLCSTVVGPLAGTNPLACATLTVPCDRVWHSPEMSSDPMIDGVVRVRGHMTVLFGAVRVPMGRDRSDSIRYFQLVLAGGVADTLGLLLALIWTAGFLPASLEASAASVLLAKPVPRWSLLLGKYLGVLAFVGCQAALFVVLTWMALAVRTGIWEGAYLWCIPLLLLQFSIFYSFSVLLAVVARSMVACVFGSLVFWLIGWGLNYGWVVARLQSQTLSSFGAFLLDVVYWISPKPIDLSLILFNTLDAQRHFDKPAVFKAMEAGDGFSPVLAILTSVLFSVVMLGLAMHEFNSTDY